MTPKDENSESRFNRRDIYTRVTDRIISDLEQGVRTWLKPWSAEHAAGRISRPLRHNGMAYRGMNVLLLWGEAMAKSYAAPIWVTFKQALEFDAHVRKGEHGSLVVYANSISKTETGQNGEDVERAIRFMKGYTVFNVEQIDGLAAHYYAKPENPLPLSERIESADRFVTATGATIQHGGNSAFYAPSRDLVQMPPFEAFPEPPARDAYAQFLADLKTRIRAAQLRALFWPTPLREVTAVPGKCVPWLCNLQVRRHAGLSMDPAH